MISVINLLMSQITANIMHLSNNILLHHQRILTNINDLHLQNNVNFATEKISVHVKSHNRDV